MERKRSQSAEVVWRDRLVRFRECDLTVKEFCRREGVSSPCFYQWRRRITGVRRDATRGRRSGDEVPRTARPQTFVPVRVSRSGSGNSIGVADSLVAEVALPNGVCIRVPAADVEALRVAIVTGSDACREVR